MINLPVVPMSPSEFEITFLQGIFQFLDRFSSPLLFRIQIITIRRSLSTICRRRGDIFLIDASVKRSCQPIHQSRLLLPSRTIVVTAIEFASRAAVIVSVLIQVDMRSIDRLPVIRIGIFLPV